MISKIVAKNLKNRSFTYSLGPKTIIVGDNGTGKSAILAAISLLRMGYVPGKGKQPVATMDALATDSKMIVEGEVHGLHVMRRFMRTSAGAKQDFAVGHRKTDKTKFEGAISVAPMLLDLSNFTDLSEKKQIEYLIDLYGDNDDLLKIDGEIAQDEEKLNYKRSEKKKKEATIEETVKSIAEIELPSSTLAEVQEQIQNVLDEYERVNQELSDARSELNSGKNTQSGETSDPTTHPSDRGKAAGQNATKSVNPSNDTGQAVSVPSPPPKNNDAAIQAIQRIVEAMEQNCSVCAAKIKAKMEIRNLQKEEKF